jgi:hypothetical protein
MIDPNLLSATGQAADLCGFLLLAVEWLRAIRQTREADIQLARQQIEVGWSDGPEEIARKMPGIVAAVDRKLFQRKLIFYVGLALVIVGFALQIAGSLLQIKT